MSDDRLFASNNAIGRKWYFLNLIILAIIVLLTHYIYNTHIVPYIRSEVYEIIAKGIVNFIYIIYLITYFALIERRLYDICGRRDCKKYSNISGFLKFFILFQVLILAGQYFNVAINIGYDFLQEIAYIFDGIFILITFLLVFPKGKISNLTYEQYKNKVKYLW